MTRNSILARRIVGIAVPLLAVAGFARGVARDEPPEALHPVLAKYPSPEDVAEQVRQLEAASPGVVEAIRADFDLAIRSALDLTPPAQPGQPVPRVIDETALHGIYTRDIMEREISRRVREGATKLVDFLRAHYDELTIRDCPDLPVVMMDVLAHGWDDWSAWSTPKLEQMRRKHPDLHRKYALTELERLRHKPAVGLVLRALAEDTDWLVPDEAFLALRAVGEPGDVLRFCVDLAPRAGRNRQHIWLALSDISSQVEPAERRAFWQPYADSGIPMLWYPAQLALERPVPKGWRLWDEYCKWAKDNDPDPQVREEMAARLRIHEIMRNVDPVTGRPRPDAQSQPAGDPTP